ncbi:magnesium transporter MgtE N-terminal domain-containing protein [Granulicella aggregans]|uniref:magnesium transporter MgtE N-terminal domain-containing protein n=1 Tax=Granulicella aggregans TaxID=474949 RepID=UPI0021E03BBD|nr:CBS domain-containing protein [Granulicella aggregans]
MTLNAHIRTSVATLMGAALVDARGTTLGHVSEFAVSPMEDSGHIRGVLVRLQGSGRKTKPSLVPISEIQLTETGEMQLKGDVTSLLVPQDDEFLLLERDLLDQQIIDVHGHKVVRVNDVDLVWEPEKDGAGGIKLRIAEVEVGVRGAIRRLLKGLPASAVDGLATRVKSSVIPWEFVDLIDRDPGRRVKLKIEQERLSRMHPADIAEILEELAPAERQALFNSLDEEVAAEALEEVEPKLQKALIADLDSESVAGIVEEMDPGAAADLLSELTEERSDAILEEMDPEERQEVEELLEFSADSAAGQMTTDYVALGPGATVANAIAALQEYEGDVETLTDIYLLDADERLHGIVPLVKLVLTGGDVELAALTTGHLVTTHVDERAKKVAELFDKYNLRSLPVVDKDKKMVGVILAEHVIAQLRER